MALARNHVSNSEIAREGRMRAGVSSSGTAPGNFRVARFSTALFSLRSAVGEDLGRAGGPLQGRGRHRIYAYHRPIVFLHATTYSW